MKKRVLAIVMALCVSSVGLMGAVAAVPEGTTAVVASDEAASETADADADAAAYEDEAAEDEEAAEESVDEGKSEDTDVAFADEEISEEQSVLTIEEDSDQKQEDDETAGENQKAEDLDEEADIDEIEDVTSVDYEKTDDEFDEEDSFSETGKTEEELVVEEEIEINEVKEEALTGDVVASGSCGENVTWTLTGTGNNLTLTISGSGEMYDYDNYNTYEPWYTYRLKIKTVVIEAEVSRIGNNAFDECSNINRVVLSDSVTQIGNMAFRGCDSLENITLPDGLTEIGNNAFTNCYSLESINLPDGLIELGWGAFNSCSSLESITIPEGITAIGEMMFYNCSNLKSVDIPDGVTEIGSSTFSDCSNLTEISIPDGVTQILSHTFYGCKKLANFDFPKNLESIGDNAFYQCQKLTSIAIPDSVTSIGWYAFGDCSSLETVTIPEDVTRIQSGTFYFCRSLKSITIPGNVKRIESGAFDHCESLTSITIPDSVKRIDDNAFYFCFGLTSITIPSSVTTIEENAFFSDYMHADVYTVQGCTADQYFATLDNGDTLVFNIHYPCGPEGHTYGDWEVTSEPTCKDPGIKERRCTNCGDVQTEEIPVTNNHVWNDFYTVDIEPTYDEEGSESFHCSICGVVKEGSERAVPKLPKPVSYLIISGVENRIYEGQEVTLDLVVIDNEIVLEEGVDYTVTYNNNSYVGKASVTVAGIGHYEGSVSRQFLILPGAPAKVTCKNLADGIKISWEKVEGATSYYVYRDDKLLFRESRLERLDREVKYECGKKYTYRVIATTKDVGNSTRSRTCKMFRLMPVKITKLSNPSAGKLKVEYEKSPGCYGYVVRYGLKSDMSDASVVSVKGENTLSRVFSGAKKGKTYYVQVRTYMLEYGLRYYSGYCTTQKITITK